MNHSTIISILAIAGVVGFLGSSYAENKAQATQPVVQVSEKYKDYQKPSNQELLKFLTPLQFRVTQHEDTERPFKNEYWDNKAEGIYVDIISGEPLFSSIDKFKSGTGWPSFTKPIGDTKLIETTDRKFFMTRTELKSPAAKSHLGHVFNDGPNPTGLRYCINSASLRFVPKKDLEKEGYGEFLALFNQSPK